MMKKIFVAIGIFVFTSVVFAGENLLKNADFANGSAQWSAGKYPHYMKDGKFVADIPKNCGRWSILLAQRLKLKPGKYQLSYTLECQKPGIMRQVYQLSQKPYASLGLSLNLDAVQGKKNYDIVFLAKGKKPGIPKLLTFNLSGLHGRIVLSNLKLEELPVLPLAVNKSWTVFSEVKSPGKFDIIPQTMRNIKGNMVKALKVSLKNNSIDLAALNGGNFNVDSSIAMLYNEFECSKNGTMLLGVSADYWVDIYLNGKHIFKGTGLSGFSPGDNLIEMNVNKGKNLLAVKVRSGSRGWRFVCGVPGKPIKFKAGKAWKVVDMSNVRVKAGSALDLSKISAVSSTSAGTLPRLVIGATGKLEAQNNPGKALRLNGYALGISSWYLLSKSNMKDELSNIVKLSRIQGYNFLRSSIGLICPKKNLIFDKQALDKVDYLLSCMKREGVYMHLILYAYHLYHNRKTWGPIWKLRDDNKVRMFLGDPVLRKEFKEVIGKLMNHVNPYTGLAWKDDPVFACLELYNEQLIGLLNIHKKNIRPETLNEFHKQFRSWLKNKYTTPAKLSEAWKDKNISSFEAVKTPKRLQSSKNKFKEQDLMLFLNKLSRENVVWLKDTLRNTGYKGLIAQYNFPMWMGSVEARFENSQIAICNTYFKHPTMQTKKGSRCSQISSVYSEGGYFCRANATRFADRPFFITETNHAFWNQYQHEGGIMFGAYAALQGFDARIAHAYAAILNENFSTNSYRDACSAFSIGNNPVARANEFLSACLYLRGDVQTSAKRVQLNIPKTSMTSSKAVSLQQCKIALMTGFSVSFPWAKAAPGVGVPKRPDMVIMADKNNSDTIKVGSWSSEIVSSKKSKFALDAFVNKMKAKGLLPKSNMSVPSKGIYQSDTGEIILRAKENLMKVCTPRSEAVTLEANKGELIGQLRVIHTSVPALVAACSVDGKNLADSKRIIFIYSTEIANTDMVLSYDRVRMINLGKRPVLMRTGKLEVVLKNKNHKKMSFYSLGFDGSRRNKLATSVSNDTLKIQLDTGLLEKGPTPFFELAVD